MPIDITCSSCGNVATVPDSAAGDRRFCKLCGTAYRVPAAPVAAVGARDSSQKLCRGCGVDVSQSKRFRQTDGTYECPDCFENPTARVTTARMAHAGAGASKAVSTEAGLDFGPAALGDPSDWPGDNTVDGADDKDPADVVYYPCRVCEGLFWSTEVFSDMPDEVICKSCLKELDKSVPALPEGLELTSEPIAIPVQDEDDTVFCENCNRSFPPGKLKTLPGGAIVCRQCAQTLSLRAKQEARQQERLAQFIGKPKIRRENNTSYRKIIVCIVCGLGGIAFLLWNLKKAGLFEQRGHRDPNAIVVPVPAK